MQLLSLNARSTEITLDLNYGPDPFHKVDICRPAAGTGNGSSVILIHGGGWIGGDKKSLRSICSYFADRGVFSANVSYRLMDGAHGSWPDQLVDVQLAVRWMRAHARDFQIDPNRICAYGHSAGGHLTLMLATSQNTIEGDYSSILSQFSSRIACGVDNWGPTDLTVKSPFVTTLAKFFPGNERDRNLKAKEVSPLYLIGPRTAPLFVAHGLNDQLVSVSQSFHLVDALTSAKVPVQLMAFYGGHEFANVPSSLRAAIQNLEFTFIYSATPMTAVGPPTNSNGYLK